LTVPTAAVTVAVRVTVLEYGLLRPVLVTLVVVFCWTINV
jgi:hypothetical protein